MRPKPWVILALAVVLGAGAWLRLASLGRLSFWNDEFPHAVAARNLNADRGPVLPSGIEYRRALGQTVLVAASMRIGGSNETAARVPSALVGIATIPLVWLALRRRYGDVAGAAAAGALALMPLHIAHSRSARFYAGFVVAYGATAVLGSRALRDGSLRAGLGALGAFAVALHLQLLAVTVLAPLAVEASVAAFGPAGERRVLRRWLRLTVLGAVAALVVAIAVPGFREALARTLERPVPGLELSPGLRLGFAGGIVGLVSWWAWIPLAPAAVWALRRTGRAGLSIIVHLAVPAVALSVLYRPVGAAGIPIRYGIQLAPFVAAAAGIGAAEIARRITMLIRERAREPVSVAVAVAVAAVAIAGVSGSFWIPGDRHPGRVIPRPNYRAVAAIVASRGAADDALLSTGPLAMAWELGRCGDWLRSREAAAPFMRGDRDVYCGSVLVPHVGVLRAYVAAYPRGWIVADPMSWRRQVDAAVRSAIAEIASEIPVDPSVLVYRWGS